MQLLKTYGCVAIAFGLVALAVSPVWSQDADVDTAKAQLARGIEQFDQMRFNEAKQVLLKVNPSKLPTDADRNQLEGYLDKVNAAMLAQSQGRELFRQAHGALNAGKFGEAEALFQQVLANEFVPEPMKKDARSLAAVAAAKRVRQAAGQGAEAAPAEAAPAVEPAEARRELETAAQEQQAPEAEAKPTDTWVAPAGEEAAKAHEPPAAEDEAKPPVANDDVVDENGRRTLAAQAAAIRAKADALQLVQQGNMALEVGNATQAADAFRKALELAPDMPEARSGLDQAAELLPRTPSGSMDVLIQKRQLALQKAQADFDKAIAESRLALAAAATELEFRTAAERARYALSILEGSKRLFSTDDYAIRQSLANNLLDTIDEQQDRWSREQVRFKRTIVTEQAAAYEQEQRRQRAEKVEILRASASLLEREQRYAQAIETVEEILRLEPLDAWAAAKVESLRQSDLLEQQSDAYRTRMIEEGKQLVDMEWEMVPWWEMLQYPKNWDEITRRRTGIGSEYDSPANRETAQKLDEIKSAFDFNEMELEGVVIYLREITKANIVVNWQNIEAAGLGKDTPVTLILNNVSTRQALDEILSSVSGVIELGYVIKDGMVRISTRDDLASIIDTRVYDIQDLLIQVPDFVGPVVSISRSTASGGGNSGSSGSSGSSGGGLGGSGGGQQGGFGGQQGGQQGGFGGQQGQGSATAVRQQMVADILDTVRTSIDASSWILNGGVDGSIRELNGSIIVTQTPENHQRLQDLFAQLRESQSVAVNVEYRTITVRTGFLNDVGLDLSFFMNIGSTLTQTGTTDPVTGAQIVNQGSTALPQWANSASWGNKTSPIGVRQQSSSFTAFPSTTVPDSIASAASLATDGLGALSFGGSFLDDIQVDFLVRATQADQRTTEFIAPRMTLMSGQRANVMIGTEQNYVSDLTPVTNDNVATFDTEVSTVFTGNTLDVQATVSHDRRYVTLTLMPTNSRVMNFTSYAVQSSASGTSSSQSGSIMLPELAINTIQTTVVIPDRGTLLIGGQRTAGEITREMGVPILSKVPIINRLFTNRSSSRDEVIILMLIKPTIIISREYEEDYYSTN